MYQQHTALSRTVSLKMTLALGRVGRSYIYPKDREGSEEIPIASNSVQASESLCSPIFEHNFQQVP